jgi:hypoxanthine phosphoribosyltransferase
MIDQSITFPQDTIAYSCPTWDELDALTLQVANQVLASESKFDVIVALAKGAWPMSRSFVDYTKIPELMSLGVRFYSGINQRLAEPSVYQTLPSSVAGKKVLIFDDVADSGESLVFTKKYLLEQGAALVATATLMMKPHTILKPDFYAHTTSTWIIFPFEKREMCELLGKKWQGQGVGEEEIKERFEQLKINSRWR